MKSLTLLLVAVSIVFGFATIGLSKASPSHAISQTREVTKGNNCVECHSVNDPRLAEPVLRWRRSVYRAKYIPCQPLRELEEGMYQAGTLLCIVTRASSRLAEEHVATGDWEKSALAQRDTLNVIQQKHVISVSQINQQTKVVNFQTNKLYVQINQMRDELRKRIALGVATLIALFIIFGIFIGLHNILESKRKQRDAETR
ncbi:MAG: hypothetical protein M1136_09255 [Chloroflexi bacterium]|nr:hypothetical protein [Chloroflexota bacterium]